MALCIDNVLNNSSLVAKSFLFDSFQFFCLFVYFRELFTKTLFCFIFPLLVLFKYFVERFVVYGILLQNSRVKPYYFVALKSN